MEFRLSLRHATPMQASPPGLGKGKQHRREDFSMGESHDAG
jgi:hypothetical protein